MIDLLIGSLHSPWAEELISGAVDAAAESGVSVLVTTVASREEFTRWLDQATAPRGTGGALCVLHLPRSPELQRLAAAQVPADRDRPAGRTPGRESGRWARPTGRAG